MKKLIVLISMTILMSNSGCSQNQKKETMQEKNNLSELYKKVKKYEEQPEYWIFIHSNNCSYVATINDMPIYTDFNDGSMKSLSFPLNPLLPNSGAYALKLRLLPKQDDDFNLGTKIEKDSKIQIKISRSANKQEKIILDETVIVNEGALPLVEKNFTFNIDVPYSLVGWSKSIDLTKEDKEKLTKEVADFYQKMMNLYEKKQMEEISSLYYPRQLENAQSLYSSTKADSDKLLAKLNQDVNQVQEFKLEDYKLQFYGNGKVVGLIRTDGEFLGKSAFLGLTDEDFYIYSLLLHRPKSGASLEVIR
jgi:hypothetical protein